MAHGDFVKTIEEAIEESRNYQTCMSLHVCRESKSVTLNLDTACDYYTEWIKGEGSDIGLFRDRETNKVIGVRLPLYNERLGVDYDGPMRINTGFLKADAAGGQQ